MHGTLQFHEHGIGAAKQLDNNNIRKSLTNVENVKKIQSYDLFNIKVE